MAVATQSAGGLKATLGSAPAPQPRPVRLTVDLIEASRQQLTLLRAVHGFPKGALYDDGEVMHAALRRYDAFLGLLPTEGGAGPVVPPLDCAWLWHAHRLNPLAYAADCKQRFGALVDVPKGMSPFAFCTPEEEDAPTRALWENRFPGVPFHLNASSPSAGLELLPASSGVGATAIAECACRQKDFLWQVSSPLYSHPAFLADGLRRYTQFLQLMALHPGAFLVPAYDMDLMWHSHLGHPGAYVRDTTAAVGCVVVHDDTVNDRAEGSKLNTSAEETAALWARAFPGETWAKRGAMFCGPPPPFYHAAEPRWRGGMPVAESYVQPMGMQQPGVTMVPVTTGCCCCEEVKMVPVANRANPAFMPMQPAGMYAQPMMAQPMYVQQPVMMAQPMYGGMGYGGGMGIGGGLGTGLAIGAGAVLGAELMEGALGGGSCGGGFGGGFGGGSCGGGSCGGGSCGGGW